jgi:plastocyanin
MDQQTIQPNNTPSGVPDSVPAAGSGDGISSTPASGSKPDAGGKGFRTWLSVVAAVAIVGAIGGLLYQANHTTTSMSQTVTQQTIAPAIVSITPNGFVPATVSVDVGQAVVWTNTDTHPHGVASDPYPTDGTLPGLNSGATQLTLHDRYSYIFKTAGAYTYHDSLHPGLDGTVIVK